MSTIIKIGMRVTVASIDDSEPEGLYDWAVGKEGTVAEHFPYTGGYFMAPWGVRFDNGDSLFFYAHELSVVPAHERIDQREPAFTPPDHSSAAS